MSARQLPHLQSSACTQAFRNAQYFPCDLQTAAERATAKTPKQCVPSAVRLTATSSGISVDEAAIIAAEAAAAGDTAPAALARVFPKARTMLLFLEHT